MLLSTDYPKKMSRLPNNKLLLLGFLILSSLYGCSKEEEENKETPKFRILETTYNDLGKIDKSEDFYYKGGKLERVVTTQVITTTGFEPYIDKDTIQLETEIEYSGNKVIISEALGNVLTYTLNEQGLADRCSLQEPGSDTSREYTFTYTPTGMLTNMEEHYNSIRTAYQISYSDNNLTKTTTQQHDYPDFASDYSAGNIENRRSFPCPIIIESYPCYFHRIAWYMGIAGKLSEYLVDKTVPVGATKEETTYAYTINEEGYVTSCIEKTQRSNRIWSRKIEFKYY